VDILRGGKFLTVRPFQLFEASLVLIHHINVGMWTYQLAQGKREGARARAEVRPGAAKRQVRRPEEVNVVAVIHIAYSSSGTRQSAVCIYILALRFIHSLSSDVCLSLAKVLSSS
jgi:hypothetical protein